MDFEPVIAITIMVALLCYLTLQALQKTTQATLLAELAVITGMSGPLHTVNATLFTTNIPFNMATSVLADFVAVAASWTGSTPKVITWGSPFVQPSGFPAQESQLLQWICSAAPSGPVNNYGVYYDDGTNLLGVDYFPAPIIVQAPYNSVQWIASAP